VELYRSALALNGRDKFYLLNLGDSSRRLGHAKDAAAAYRSGREIALNELKQNPGNGYIRAFVAYFSARLGDPARAEEEIGQAVQSSPGDGKVIRRAVLTFEALGMTDRALDMLANATPDLLQELARQPDMADLRRNPRFIQLTGNAGTHNGGR